MRKIKYILLPDVAGKYTEKEAELSEFCSDVKYIIRNKNIPPLSILNEALRLGHTPREAEWEPFELSIDEYEALVMAIKKDPPIGYQCIEPPETVTSFQGWLAWIG